MLNNLAQTLSDLGRDEEALPVIERAVAAGGPFAAGGAEDARRHPEEVERSCQERTPEACKD